jgi:hypothetical protein
MTMTVPSSGMAQSRVLIFSKGLMYLGSSMGAFDQRSGALTMMSQMSHFATRVVSDGIQKQSGVFVDSMLTGKMGMNLSLNFFTGMIEVRGDASYFRYDPMLTNVALTVTTQTGANNLVANSNSNLVSTSNSNAQSATVNTTGTNSNATTTTSAGQGSSESTTNTATHTAKQCHVP